MIQYILDRFCYLVWDWFDRPEAIISNPLKNIYRNICCVKMDFLEDSALFRCVLDKCQKYAGKMRKQNTNAIKWQHALLATIDVIVIVMQATYQFICSSPLPHCPCAIELAHTVCNWSMFTLLILLMRPNGRSSIKTFTRIIERDWNKILYLELKFQLNAKWFY